MPELCISKQLTKPAPRRLNGAGKTHTTQHGCHGFAMNLPQQCHAEVRTCTQATTECVMSYFFKFKNHSVQHLQQSFCMAEMA